MNLFSMTQKLWKDVKTKFQKSPPLQKSEEGPPVEKIVPEPPREIQSTFPEKMKKVPFANLKQTSDFFAIHPEIVYRFALKRMNKAIQKDLPITYLFRIGDTVNYTKIYENDYINVLSKMEEVFKEKELYMELEQTIALKNLLTQKYVDRVIEESKRM